MDKTQRDREIYKLAVAYLVSLDGITREMVAGHLTPDRSPPATLEGIYRQLLISAQSANMGPGVIGAAIGGVDSLRPLLCEFKPKAIADIYPGWEALLDDIVKHLKPTGKIRRTRRSLWPRFCGAVLSGARFLSQFDSAETFYDWVAVFDEDDRIRPTLPMLLAAEIDGFGFPLACDFLMELGYTGFGKPDVHLKRIFTALRLSDRDNDYYVFKAIVRVSRSVGVEPYGIDKVFWLIGSGDFYRTGLKVGSHREDFIQHACERMTRTL